MSLPTDRKKLALIAACALLAVVCLAVVLFSSDNDPDAVASDRPVTTTAPTTTSTSTTTTTEPPAAVRSMPIGHPYVPLEGGGGAGSGGVPLGGAPAGPPPVLAPVPVQSHIAEVIGTEVEIQSAPDGPGTAILPAVNGFGSRQTFLVYGQIPGWVEVWLPTRPNGSRGWVRAETVRITATPYAIGIDLAARRMTVFDGGFPLMTADVAIGTPSAPTPTGLHYVTDLISTPSPGGAYGPYAFGLSAHSDVHTEFAGGDGQVGLHGTNQPGLMGQAVSAGCIRMPNDFVTRLVGLLPLGTPVLIQ